MKTRKSSKKPGRKSELSLYFTRKKKKLKMNRRKLSSL